MWHMDALGWGWWVAMSIVELGFLVAVVWAVTAVVRSRQQRRPSDLAQPPQLSAREILDRRLASGEITVEEYEQRRRLLDASSHPPARATR